MSTEAYQPQISGELTRLQSRLRALERAVMTRDEKLKDSFGNMQSEMDCLWKEVNTAKIDRKQFLFPLLPPKI